MTERRHHTRLAGMARITLLDGNNNNQASGARFRQPHSTYVGNAGSLHLLPDQGRPHEGTHVVELARRTCRRSAQDNRVVAVVESLHLHGWLRPHRTGVVTSPFAE